MSDFIYAIVAIAIGVPSIFILTIIVLIFGGNRECYECGERIQPKALTRNRKCLDCINMHD